MSPNLQAALAQNLALPRQSSRLFNPRPHEPLRSHARVRSGDLSDNGLVDIIRYGHR